MSAHRRLQSTDATRHKTARFVNDCLPPLDWSNVMGARQGESFDDQRLETIVTPSTSVRHSFGDGDKFFVSADRIPQKTVTAMPISNAFTIEHHKIKRKKMRHRTKLQKVPSHISENIDDPIDEIEMKIGTYKQITRKEYDDFRKKLQDLFENPEVRNSKKQVKRLWDNMRHLTDSLLQLQTPQTLSVAPRVRKNNKDIGTMTDKMDVSNLSASDEFFIEFELNKKYHNSIDDLRQMKHHLQSLEEATPSDAAAHLRQLRKRMEGDVMAIEEAVGDYDPESFDNIHVAGWQMDMMTRIKEMQVKTASKVMQSFKMDIESVGSQTDFKFYSEEDWAAQERYIKELNDNINELTEKKDDLIKDIAISKNERENLLQEIASSKAEKVEAETLLDRAVESTNLYRREAEIAKTDQQALKTVKQADNEQMEKYKKQIDSLSGQNQKLRYEMQFKDTELAEASERLNQAVMGGSSGKPTPAPRGERTPAESPTPSQQPPSRENPRRSPMMSTPASYRRSATTAGNEVQGMRTPQQGNLATNSQLNTPQPRSNQSPNPAYERSQTNQGLAGNASYSSSPQYQSPSNAARQATSNAMYDENTIMEEDEQERPGQVNSSGARYVARDPAARNTGDTGARYAGAQAAHDPGARYTGAQAAHDPGAPGARYVGASHDVGAHDPASNYPGSSYPGASQATPRNLGARAGQPGQFSELDSLVSDEDPAIHDVGTPMGGSSPYKTPDRTRPSPSNAQTNTGMRFMGSNQGSTSNAMEYTPGEANPEDQVLGDLPNGEEEVQRSPNKGSQSKNLSPSRNRSPKKSTRQTSPRKPRGGKAQPINKFTGSDAPSSFMSENDYYPDQPVVAISSRGAERNPNPTAASPFNYEEQAQEQEQERPVPQAYVPPVRDTPFTVKDAYVDTTDLKRMIIKENSIIMQTGEEEMPSIDISGNGGTSPQRERQKYIFKMNPTSFLGLQGDVFYKSSAAVFAAAPKLPENPSQTVAVKKDTLDMWGSPLSPSKTNDHSPR